LPIALAGEEDFHLAGEMFQACGARGRLRVDAGAATEETRGNDARVVQEDEFVASEEFGEIPEEVVVQAACRSIDLQQAGSVATVQGPLGNLAGR
jgi:hypothetical protein